jgi:hypothetical protein
MPRYYRYGYTGPDYAALWTNEIPMPQSQAAELRSLGASADEVAAVEVFRAAIRVGRKEGRSEAEIEAAMVAMCVEGGTVTGQSPEGCVRAARKALALEKRSSVGPLLAVAGAVALVWLFRR